MKQTKLLLLTSVLTLLAFSAVLYSSSCKKDPCSGVTCLNGGACNNGNCVCPTGYSGANCENADQTTLVYQNNTFTPVTITINGSSATIAAGGTASFLGFPGDDATGTATTSGFTTSGTRVGLLLSWTLSDVFPAASSQTDYINVSSDFFYLKIVDNSAYNIGTVYVNYGLSAQTVDYVTLYNTGVTYGVGYYSAFTNTNLYLQSTPTGNYWNYNISLPFTQNQSYTFTAL